MSCENLTIPKPLTSACPTGAFGIPWGQSGRTVAATTYPIAGIVLHCYDGTVSELCNSLSCLTKNGVITGSCETSFHYGVGATGNIRQFIEDTDISWAFGTYKNNSYATVPPPNCIVNWPTLQGEHGLNTTPDVYILNVAIALGTLIDDRQTCYECPSASGLPDVQHRELVQLLAYLAQEYEIPIDEDHITWHDLIRCDETQHCQCVDLDTLLTEIASLCPPCEGDEAPVAPVAEVDDNIQYLLGVTEPCCETSAGCFERVPFDPCFFGNIIEDGTLDSYIVGLSEDPVTGQQCLVRGCLGVISPIIGCGTVDDPLRLDRCAFGAWLPDEIVTNAVNLVAVDDQGCLIEVPACELVTECETEITVIDTNCIDLTVSGTSNHTLQADIIISPDPGNQVECRANGLFAIVDCEEFKEIFETVGIVDWIPGVNDQGDCVQENIADIFDRLFMVQDTDCIDLDWTNNVLTATPIIAPEPQGDVNENNLFCLQDGLFVPRLQILDGFTINLGLGGTYDHILSADIIFSQNPENLAGVDFTPVTGGLLVTFNANNTDCISLDLTTGNLTATPVISPPIGGISNVLECTQTGLYVPRGANANVNAPITGDGSDINPLDIDFSLMDAQDLCDFGGTIVDGTLEYLVGVDQAECLRRQTPADVLAGVLSVSDTNCIDLDFTNSILSANPIIAPAADNMLVCTAQGLYVPLPTGGTTDCIEVNVSAGGVITATLDIDPQGDNVFTCTPNGAYVQVGAGLTVQDTDCIDLDLVAGQLQAFPILAGTQGGVPNVLNCLAGQGLYVPEGAGLSVQNGDCIDMSLTGAVLRADIVIDPTGDNQVGCLPAGIYVPPLAGLLVDDTDCMSVDITGQTLTASPILAPAQGGVSNALVCLAGQGLYVPGLTTSDLLTVQDTDCIDLTISGSGVLSADPIISPDDCNGLSCRANGLYINNDVQGFASQTTVSSIVVNIAVPGGLPPVETAYGTLATLAVSNPSTCNQFAVYRAVQSASANFFNTCGIGTAEVTMSQQYSTTGPGGPWLTTETVRGDVPVGERIGLTAQGFDAAFIQAVAQTNTLWVRTVFSNPDGNFCGSFSSGDKTITIIGTGIIN